MNDLNPYLGRPGFRDPGEDYGEAAYRDHGGFFPEDAREGTLWPPRPGWFMRAKLFVEEHWARLCRARQRADDIHDGRLLWRRHPWMRTGNVWWRPWWPEPNMEATGKYETFDTENGLHRWKIIFSDLGGDFAFDTDKYYVAVLRRNVR